MNIGLVLLAVFLALMTGIGVWSMKKTKNLNDFFLGGRTLGPWISAATYGTTYFSAVIFIGFAGTQGWQFGLNALWIALGNGLIGACAAWLVLARRTRRMTQNLNAMTMPEFLQERFGAKHLKPIAALIVFLFLLPYSASVFRGLGFLFQEGFGIPFDAALLLIVAFTGIYLILGGYFAVAFTSFVQAIIMFAGAIAIVFAVTAPEGGVFGIVGRIAANYAAHIPPEARPSPLTVASLVFMTSFGVWGLPQMTQRFYSIKNESIIPKATIVTTVFALVIGFSAYYTGAASHVFFDLNSIPRNEAGGIIFDRIVPILFTQRLPQLLMALILLLILSASMSTLSSLVLVSSSAIAIDLFRSRSVAMMRVLSAVFIVISFFISRFQFSIIVYLMSLSWGLVSGAFAAPYILGLYSKRVTKAGAYAGILTGVVVMTTLFFILGQANSPLSASIAIVAPFISVFVVSMFTQPPEKEIIDKAFSGV